MLVCMCFLDANSESVEILRNEGYSPGKSGISIIYNPDALNSLPYFFNSKSWASSQSKCG